MEISRYNNYRETGIGWIPEIPEHWDLMKISHLAQLKSGENITSLKIKPSGEYPVFGGNGLRGFYESFTHDGEYILIGRQGALCGNINYARGKFWASEHAVVVTPDRELSKKWLGEVLRTMNLGQYSVSAAQPGISVEMITKLKVPFPPVEEQTKIANFLDRKTAQIDQLIAKKRTLIEKLNEKRIAMITQAVTKGLNPTVQMKDSGVDWLGEVPEHWETMKMSHIVRLRSGESITSMEVESTGTYPVFGGNGHRGYFEEYTHDGDFVLIGRQGALCGNINYAFGKFWASEHAIVVSPDRPLRTIWLGELLRVMNLGQYSVSAAQPGISVEQIGRLKMPYPLIEEQQKIADYIDKESNFINKLVAITKKTINRLTEYRTTLITAAVTGKIDVRNVSIPNQESA